MVFATGLVALLFYAATVILLVGLTRKVIQYWRTPSPLKIPVTPAPTTRVGLTFRMARELFLFASLFRSNKWTWLFGWLMHVGLFLVTIRHLRYFVEPVWGWVAILQPLGVYGGYMMVVGLAGLWARRLLVDRVRYITRPSDHLMLAMLTAIVGSGLLIAFVTRTDVVAVKVFFLGLMRLDFANLQVLPMDGVLFLHLLLVVILMIVFPFSKLLHVPGLFFSPTLSQLDNPRERRQLAPWAAQLESTGDK